MFVPRGPGRGRGRRLGAERVYRGARTAQRPRGVRGDRHAKGPVALAHLSSRRCRPASTATGGQVRYDHRPSSQQLALAAHPVDAGGARPRLRGQALPARARRCRRRRRCGRSIRSASRRSSPTATRRWPSRARSSSTWSRPTATAGSRRRRHAGAAALHLLPALRRRLADAAAADEAGVQPHARAHAVADAAGRRARSRPAPTSSCSTRRSATTSPSSRASSPAATGSPAPDFTAADIQMSFPLEAAAAARRSRRAAAAADSLPRSASTRGRPTSAPSKGRPLLDAEIDDDRGASC